MRQKIKFNDINANDLVKLFDYSVVKVTRVEYIREGTFQIFYRAVCSSEMGFCSSSNIIEKLEPDKYPEYYL